MKSIIAFLIVSILSVLYSQGYTQAGSLDPSFNGSGKVITSVGTGHDQALAVAIQSDGKIVVVGSAVMGNAKDFAIVRYNVNGTLDNTFSGDGKMTVDFSGGEDIAQAVSILSNGNIIVAGRASIGTSIDFAIAVITPSGQLDRTFSGDGKLTTDFNKTDDYAYAMEIHNNRIILAGTSIQNGSEQFAVAMYLMDGTLDNSFSNDGLVTVDIGPGSDFATCLAIQQDHKIVIGGYSGYDWMTDFALMRLNRDGSLDLGFNNNGKVITDLTPNYERAYGVVIQPDQKIILGGYAFNIMNNDFALVRYMPDGSLDRSFSGSGKVISPIGQFFDEAFAMKLQPDGKIVMAGEVAQASTDADFGLARFNVDGKLDKTFRGSGYVAMPIGMGVSEDVAYAMALQSDGKIILAGEAEIGSNNEFAVARFFSGLSTSNDEISDLEIEMNVFPNPVTGQFITLEYDLTSDETVSLILCDPTGRVLKTIYERELKSKGIHKEFIRLNETMLENLIFIVLSNGINQKSIPLIK